MSYPRNMAGAVALLASSSLLGLGCMVAADEPGEHADEHSIGANEGSTLDSAGPSEGSAGNVSSDNEIDDESESTGESKDALWYGGYGRRFGGFGYPSYGRRSGFGYPGFGFGRFGYPLHGYGSLYGFGYPFYGYGGYGYGCGFYGC